MKGFAMKRRNIFSLATALLLSFIFVDIASAYYNPKLGRFINRDPIGEPGAIILRQPASRGFIPRDPIPEEPNPYGYVMNSPTIMVDPFGLQSKGCCGPDVTAKLNELLAAFESMFAAAADVTQCKMCFGMVGPDGWDISEFHFAGLTDGYAPFQKDGCGTGGCAGTIAVGGQCYRANEVNYILWGKAHKLCHQAFYKWKKTRRVVRMVGNPQITYVTCTPCGACTASLAPFDLSNALGIATAWRLTGGARTRGGANVSGAGSISCRLQWTRVGWGDIAQVKDSCRMKGCAQSECCSPFDGMLSGHVDGNVFITD